MAVTSRKNHLDKRLPYEHCQMLLLQGAAVARKGMKPQASVGDTPDMPLCWWAICLIWHLPHLAFA